MNLTTADRRAHYDDFVAHVRDLCTTPRIRADLAKCRGRRVEQISGEARRCLIKQIHPYGAQRAHYTVAALIALERPAHRIPQPEPAGDSAPAWHQRPNLGATLADAASRRPASARPMDRRLRLMVRLSSDLLHPRLPGLANLLLQTGCHPDWAVLLEDLALWDINTRQVISRWQDSFYLALPGD
ncbi:type I-E CRISPR-associated protein Cse2/CasB [Streptomyces sp. NPDC059544]|uniref:type I-E CRISPR-associated protein Cse2/CasB n=1 Tax=Streptomyces sp. NPDC059544 TaxID=3346861 RepID=UPI0036D05EA2